MKSSKSLQRSELSREIKKFLDEKIHEIGKKKSLTIADNQLTADLNLYESGLLDSFDLYQFLLVLEEGLGIGLDISELDPEEFTNYGRLNDLLVESSLKTAT